MDIVNEQLNDELMDTEESPDRSTFVEGNHNTEGSTEENSRHVSGKNNSADVEMFQAATEETQLDQDTSAGFDTDELEMEEDDITSKLLSIQVLPRIPKRKPVTDNSTTTTAGDTSAFCSVLERVNSAPSSASARYPNWSAAGWSRSNIDRPPMRWSRKNTKDKKADPKPIKRSVMTEKRSSNDIKRKPEGSENKAKRAAEHSAWSPDATDISSAPSLSEIEQIAADEVTAPSLPGPLPTLPFEEQMRERARLRNLKKQGGGFDVGHNSSDATEAVLRNFDSNDNRRDGFDSAAASFLSGKADINKPPVRQEHKNVKMPSFENSASLLHTKSSENRQSLQRHPSENGHKVNKPNHHASRKSVEDKVNRLHVTRKDEKDTKAAESRGDELVPKLKKEPSSPPLPHLPVLPLFATSVSETSDSSSLRPENKTTASGKKRPLSSSSHSALTGSDVFATSGLKVSKTKSTTSAANTAGTAGSKIVKFNCGTGIQGGGETKRKSKSNVS